MTYKILVESSGSLVSNYIIKSIKQAGALAVASDVVECGAKYISDDFIIFPKYSHPHLWQIIENEIVFREINAIIPSFDETLIMWAKKKEYFQDRGIAVIVSDVRSIDVCQDKWKTYQFFRDIDIPTPETSLEKKYPLIKPRFGRGGKGILINSASDVPMEGMISQEIIEGEEYTVDIFCDKNHTPVYIIPRKRLNVVDGKSVNGITVMHEEIIAMVKKICKSLAFIGPINMQCFVTNKDNVKFIEINPRIAGGMALGFAASDNWITLIIQNIIEGKEIITKDIKYGLKMYRYYDEVFGS